MSIQIETVIEETISMDYFQFGHGENTLVIIPGLSVQSVMGLADAVEEAYKVLEDDFTVYLFDRSRELPSPCTLQQLADDTAAAIHALGLNNISLFGTSQGGMISMEIAIRHPELVQKLALGSTSSCLKDEQYKVIENWVRLAKAGDKAGLYLAFGEAVYPEAVFEQSRELLLEAAKTVTDEELKRFVILAECMKDFDITNDLVKISCPVFVIGSKDDQVLGAEASERIVKNLNPQYKHALYMYYGYGHAAYDLAPDYKERILSFLLH